MKREKAVRKKKRKKEKKKVGDGITKKSINDCSSENNLKATAR